MRKYCLNFSKIIVILLVLLSDSLKVESKRIGTLKKYNERKICKINSNLEKSFYGVTVSRQYIILNNEAPLNNFNSISLCLNNELQWEVLNLLNNRKKLFEWDKPYCSLVNKDKDKDKDKDRKINRNLEEFFKKKKVNDIKNVENHARPLITINKEVSNKVSDKSDKNKIDGKLEVSWKSVIELDGDGINKRSKDSEQYENKDIECYKFARRREYVKRRDVWSPMEWIGGLFKCELREEDKIKLYQREKLSENYQAVGNLRCSNNLTKGISPLISEDLSLQWIEKMKGDEGEDDGDGDGDGGGGGGGEEDEGEEYYQVKRVPLFYTIDEEVDESWREGIDVNEEYNFEEEEEEDGERRVEVLLRLMDRIIEKDEVEYLPWNLKKNNDNLKSSKMSCLLSNLNLEQKFVNLMGTLPSWRVERYYEEIEGIWRGYLELRR
ncbi:uncharacterized protein ASCRUDRAFT_73901 [Ascoidea rubescens DSM 1968]|uniref:Uncharacterized protein n=1 Tax=Ascoidea rubescens DSM 1968 TaxID=1344418 RepID=A0A1D2VRJ6_9ASCO|nr:hypothetical protein ASCRUDRAFT_73901 [Ascoidea rubescens DSM 1968]ODV64234.1 hypothetical protein ASCRUDRAFT_73901 [Ascoidea rubescens DSM 1968]